MEFNLMDAEDDESTKLKAEFLTKEKQIKMEKYKNYFLLFVLLVSSIVFGVWIFGGFPSEKAVSSSEEAGVGMSLEKGGWDSMKEDCIRKWESAFYDMNDNFYTKYDTTDIKRFSICFQSFVNQNKGKKEKTSKKKYVRPTVKKMTPKEMKVHKHKLAHWKSSYANFQDYIVPRRYEETSKKPFTVYYNEGVDTKNKKFCGVTFEHFLNPKVGNKWKTIKEGTHHFTHNAWGHPSHARSYDYMHSLHWKPTHKTGLKIEALFEDRYVSKPKGKNDLKVVKRFTLYDGFPQAQMGKVAIKDSVKALLETHDCKFKYMATFNLGEEDEYTSFCNYSKKHSDKRWMSKVDHGFHGHGMHLAEKKELKKLCKKGHSKIFKTVMQEFMGNTALINGYKFHVRFMGFTLARTDPFVTYWAPRHSFLRFADTKYNDKERDGYIDNAAPGCDGNEMGCYVYDTDFIDNYWVDIKKWKRAVRIMTKQSHLIVKSYYGARVFDGRTSSNRFTYFGFDYMVDEDWNPIFTEWNEEPQVRHTRVGVMERRMGNFFDGMLTIASGYANGMSQFEIDAFAKKYQMLKAATTDDTNDWMLKN